MLHLSKSTRGIFRASAVRKLHVNLPHSVRSLRAQQRVSIHTTRKICDLIVESKNAVNSNVDYYGPVAYPVVDPSFDSVPLADYLHSLLWKIAPRHLLKLVWSLWKVEVVHPNFWHPFASVLLQEIHRVVPSLKKQEPTMKAVQARKRHRKPRKSTPNLIQQHDTEFDSIESLIQKADSFLKKDSFLSDVKLNIERLLEPHVLLPATTALASAFAEMKHEAEMTDDLLLEDITLAFDIFGNIGEDEEESGVIHELLNALQARVLHNDAELVQLHLHDPELLLRFLSVLPDSAWTNQALVQAIISQFKAREFGDGKELLTTDHKYVQAHMDLVARCVSPRVFGGLMNFGKGRAFIGHMLTSSCDVFPVVAKLGFDSAQGNIFHRNIAQVYESAYQGQRYFVGDAVMNDSFIQRTVDMSNQFDPSSSADNKHVILTCIATVVNLMRKMGIKTQMIDENTSPLGDEILRVLHSNDSLPGRQLAEIAYVSSILLRHDMDIFDLLATRVANRSRLSGFTAEDVVLLLSARKLYGISFHRGAEKKWLRILEKNSFTLSLTSQFKLLNILDNESVDTEGEIYDVIMHSTRTRLMQMNEFAECLPAQLCDLANACFAVQNLRRLDKDLLKGLMKAAVHKMDQFHLHQATELAHKLRNLPPSMDFLAAVTDLAQHALDKYVKAEDHAGASVRKFTMVDFKMFAWLCQTLSYLHVPAQKLCLDVAAAFVNANLMNDARRSETNLNKITLIQFVRTLVMMNVHSTPVFAVFLNQALAWSKKSQPWLHSGYRHYLHQNMLSMQLELSHKEQKKLRVRNMNLSNIKKQIQIAYPKVEGVTNETESSIPQQEVGDTLALLDIEYEMEYTVLDTPIDGLYTIDIAVPERKLAIEFEGPRHFTKSTALVGDTLLKHRHLSLAGWNVIHIPWWEWEALDGNVALQKQYMWGMVLSAAEQERFRKS